MKTLKPTSQYVCLRVSRQSSNGYIRYVKYKVGMTIQHSCYANCSLFLSMSLPGTKKGYLASSNFWAIFAVWSEELYVLEYLYHPIFPDPPPPPTPTLTM